METKKEMFKIEGKVFITKKEDNTINPIISLMKDSKTSLIWIDLVGFIPIEKTMEYYFHEWLEGSR